MNLEGLWLPVSAELGGQKYPEELLRSMTLELKNGGYTAVVGDIVDKGTFKLAASAKPASMDVTGTDGPNAGKTFLAICERNGDTLRICYDLEGKKRPVAFKTESNTRQFLVTYQRKST